MRSLKGWKALVCFTALVGLVLAPAFATDITTMVGGDNTGLQRRGDDADPYPGPTTRSIKFPRSNYVWAYASGPFYGRVAVGQGRAPGVLHTRVGSFNLSEGAGMIPAQLQGTNKLGVVGAQYFVVQLNHASGNYAADMIAMKAQVAANGGQIISPMPVASFVARLTPGALSAIESASSVLGVQPYAPAWKLDPSIGRVPLPDPVQALSTVYNLEVKLWNGEDPQAAAQVIAELGARVTGVTKNSESAEQPPWFH